MKCNIPGSDIIKMKYSTDFPPIPFGHFPLNENSSYHSGDLRKLVIKKRIKKI